MPTPPRAMATWKSMRCCETTAPGVSPSKVAALTTRLRRVSGPNETGEKTSGTPTGEM
jgi:hypothetical protein